MKLYFHKTNGGAEYLMDTFIECESGHKEGSCTDKTKYVVRIDGDITKDAELLVRDCVPSMENSSSEINHVYHCPNCKGKKTVWTIEDYAETGIPICGICSDDMEIVRTKGNSNL